MPTNDESSGYRPPLQAVLDQVERVVTGHSRLVEQLLITVVCRAHSEIEGPPGVAKWLAVESVAQCLGLTARKLRCSPDLEPDDLVELAASTGGPGQSAKTPAGPLFGNLVLADGSEWLSPKVHNLIQQAMQERILDVRGLRWELPDPFTLFAARYPAEETEASPDDSIADCHSDRYLFRIAIPFPAYHDEYQMARVQSEPRVEGLQPLMARSQLAALQQHVYDIAASPPLIHYAVRLVRATRVHEGENPDFVYEWVQQGAGPRAVHGMVLAAKARALLEGRTEATLDDVSQVVFPVLRHRIVTNRNARSNGVSSERVIQRLLDEIPRRVVGDEKPPAPGEALTFHDWIPSE